MTNDIASMRLIIDELKTYGDRYFHGISNVKDDYEYYKSDADHYWSKLDETDEKMSAELQSKVLLVVKRIANCITQSSLLTEADRRDLGAITKSLRASLRLRRYQAWEANLLHDEGEILGIQQAGQSDDQPIHPKEARRHFERDMLELQNIIDLLEISPSVPIDHHRRNPQATIEYNPGSAFVMMQIDPQNPDLEDLYDAVKDCFQEFGISARRADEIEHEGVITSKIMEEIKSCEFLFADLTGERPSVYYEIGYAHALDRRVIMYRRSGTRLHFDLSLYNCPEYKNYSDLRTQLRKRLRNLTNRDGK